jgi:hypothetical protein
MHSICEFILIDRWHNLEIYIEERFSLRITFDVVMHLLYHFTCF